MNTDKVTRFEIINHTPCDECGGTGRVVVMDPSHREGPEQMECKDCHGLGSPGRTVYAYNENLKLELSLQDDGRTLKVFIDERKVEDHVHDTFCLSYGKCSE